ncbi:hypothetical protein UFOVP1516_92 [uncultured Caudovirales phage]|uniref:Uncharacterized protein n=1 Tax=uncultured Caudovirales phage TaxID=2100421 RepID=A0A6J7XAE8_9CAUD|nr:hypothetical protein UFOVP887_44 [uncultured Caudovirales phage]CAB5226970.1 hypothetical protein UFOVP1516_92 [uncultured Caudovirales phage]
MNDAEILTYEALLKDLKDAKNIDRGYHLDKIERFVTLINIRITKAIPKGWEIP